jgi:hypothetical protein
MDSQTSLACNGKEESHQYVVDNEVNCQSMVSTASGVRFVMVGIVITIIGFLMRIFFGRFSILRITVRGGRCHVLIVIVLIIVGVIVVRVILITVLHNRRHIEVDESLIACRVHVCPYQGQDCSANQEQGIVEQEIDGSWPGGCLVVVHGNELGFE